MAGQCSVYFSVFLEENRENTFLILSPTDKRNTTFPIVITAKKCMISYLQLVKIREILSKGAIFYMNI